MTSVYNLFHIKISKFSLLFVFGENSLLIENLLALYPFTISLQGVYSFKGLTTSSVSTCRARHNDTANSQETANG